MKGKRRLLNPCFGLIAVSLASTSCVQANRPIPVGVYRGEVGVEQLYVDFEGIYFAISLTTERRPRPDLFALRYFEYSLSKDGRITTLAATSSDLALGVSQFEWRWVEGKIAKIDRRGSGRTTWFTKVEERRADGASMLSAEGEVDQ